MRTAFQALSKSVIARALKLFSRRDKVKILIILSVQVVSGLLDLIGIALFGALGALSVSGLGAGVPSDKVGRLLEVLQISDWSFQSQVALLGGFASILLVTKTFFTAFFSRRILFFLSHRAAVLSSNLVDSLLTKSLLEIQRKSSQDHLFAVTSGVNSLILGVLGTLITLVSDISLLVIVGIGLFVVDPSLALVILLLFLVTGTILYFLMSVRARDLGNRNTDLTVDSSKLILEVLSTYRESLVRDTRGYYSKKIAHSRKELAINQAEMQFMPSISKYVIEVTLILGGVGISAMQFLLQDATHAVASLALFLAAASRISPATIRIQQGALQIRTSTGIAKSCLVMIEKLDFGTIRNSLEARESTSLTESKFEARLSIREVSFSYSELGELEALKNINIFVNPGDFVAIVGPSGSGKTTLVDIMLGVLTPTGGTISISELPPAEAIKQWPGAIAYVPQEVTVVDGTVRDNIVLGFEIGDAADQDERCWEALRAASLETEVRMLPHGLDTFVGERGTRFSGGQRQRLGIARALYTRPRLLVLDEATSALDAETELDVSNSIQSLLGKVTIVMIAHRLSTIRSANKVVYLENAQILETGTFDEVRSKVKNFDKQARLMGL
jgi:ABC-type multidrug transport system fused ATPase/permease subunit